MRLTVRELPWAREAIAYRLRARGGASPEDRHREDAILLLDVLAARDVAVTMLTSHAYGVARVLTDARFPDLSRWLTLRLGQIPSRDSSYHARGLQRIVHAEMDAAITRLIAHPRGGREPAAP